MYTSVKNLAVSVVNTMPVGTLFTTSELCDTVYEAYQGSDIDTPCNTVPQSKLRHAVRWAQQTLKQEGKLASLKQQGYWVKQA